MEKTIEIPEGYEARIEGNKVILEQKESEDEKIRKELIEFLDELWHLGKNTNFDRWGKADCAKWISYLTWQKDQQPVQDREEREYVRTIKSLIADFLRGKDEIDRGYYQKIYDWLDGRYIEQQPTNDRYMEGYVDGYAKGFENAENSYNRGVSYHFDNPNIQRLDPNVVVESKTGEIHPDVVRGTLTGGESIEDKAAIEPTPKQDYSGLTDLERAIHRGFLCAGVENVPVDIIKDTAQDCLAHIKPAGWGEEDEEMFAGIIADIKFTQRAHNHEVDQIVYEREIDWLKSISDNYKKCNSRWKPSEEQMLALGGVLDYLEESDNEDADIIRELINYLKKL